MPIFGQSTNGYKTMQRRFQDTEGAGQEMTRCNIDAVYAFAYVFAYDIWISIGIGIGLDFCIDIHVYTAPGCALNTCWVQKRFRFLDGHDGAAPAGDERCGHCTISSDGDDPTCGSWMPCGAIPLCWVIDFSRTWDFSKYGGFNQQRRGFFFGYTGM